MVQNPDIAPHQEHMLASMPNDPPAIRAALLPVKFWMARPKKAKAVNPSVDKIAPEDRIDPRIKRMVTLQVSRDARCGKADGTDIIHTIM